MVNPIKNLILAAFLVVPTLTAPLPLPGDKPDTTAPTGPAGADTNIFWIPENPGGTLPCETSILNGQSPHGAKKRDHVWIQEKGAGTCVSARGKCRKAFTTGNDKKRGFTRF